MTTKILGIFPSLPANITSSNIEEIALIENVWERILFSNFCSKKAFFEKILSVKVCLIIEKELN